VQALAAALVSQVKKQCTIAMIDRNQARPYRGFAYKRSCESNAVATNLIVDDRSASSIARTHPGL